MKASTFVQPTLAILDPVFLGQNYQSGAI